MTAAAQPWRRQPRYDRLRSGQRITVADPHRQCGHPECTTRLSRYNLDDTCNQHGGWSDDSIPQRGRRPAKLLLPVEQRTAAQGNDDGARRAAGGIPEPAPAIIDRDEAPGDGPWQLRRGDEPVNGRHPCPVTVRAEVFLEPAVTTAGRHVLVEEALRALEGATVHCERGYLSTLVSGELHEVLNAVERAHRALAPHADRVVTNLHFETCFRSTTDDGSPVAPA